MEDLFNNAPDNIQQEVKKLHGRMINDLSHFFNPKVDKWQNLVGLLGHLLRPADSAGDNVTVWTICECLRKQGSIKYGSYDELSEAVERIDVNAASVITKTAEKIKSLLCVGPTESKRLRSDSQSRRTSTDSDRKVQAMIEKTKMSIKEERQNIFLPTKGCRDSLEKLRENRVVVIKGNTGDGKTAIAKQLLRELCLEGRYPIELHNISDLDLLFPKSGIVIFLDDIFGTKVAREKDVEEWQKRMETLQPTICGKETEANYILITIRNEVFNSLKLFSSEEIFTKSNIIDLSSDNYKIESEKLEILRRYEPTQNGFSWTNEEKEEIIHCASGIGFPQCCRLFRDISHLQNKRANFFMKPYRFLNEALAKLSECPALLFLFLNGGEVKVNDLDPYAEKVDRILLDTAFKIDLNSIEQRPPETYEKRLEFVQKSLECLQDFLVAKRIDVSDDDVYTFCHDSIHSTVALLYGKATPIGFIKNCPRNALTFLTTNTKSPNRIAITPDRYTYLYKRILRELDWDEAYCGDTLGRLTNCPFQIDSLDVWKDSQFLERFVTWLDAENEDKHKWLRKACFAGAEKVVVFLLSRGVQPVTAKPLWSLVRGREDVLRNVVTYLTDEIKFDLLNDALASDADSCTSYLLSGEVETETDTPFCVVNKRNVSVLKKICKDLNAETKLSILNIACYTGAENCALFLLCDGVEPDKYTPFYVVKGGSVRVLSSQLEYDITYKARADKSKSSVEAIGINVLHEACLFGREEMVEILCDKYPHLIHGKDGRSQSIFHLVALIGNCSIFQTVEKTLLKSLCKVEDEQHKCELADGRLVHKNCACAQYVCELKDFKRWSVSHYSCIYKTSKALCFYLCDTYPALTVVEDQDKWNVLHFIARSWKDVDWFTKCETRVKQYMESTGRRYDVKNMLDKWGLSVLYWSHLQGTENNPLYDYLAQFWPDDERTFSDSSSPRNSPNHW